MRYRRFVARAVAAAMLVASTMTAGAVAARAESTPGVAAIPPVANPCPRFGQGAQITEPASLRSAGGRLSVAFSFQTTTDAEGRTLFCFMTPDGLQNPTLHVLPGDALTITVTNNTPPGQNEMKLNPPNCGANWMNSSSVNIHYHGTNTLPKCGGDEVIKTIINSGDTFQYTINFPTDQPPGLYWYHPHVHGISDAAVMGGATGALIVDGIESMQPSISGLFQRTLVLRDQRQWQNKGEGPGNCGSGVPFRDVSVNYVPVNSYAVSQRLAYFVPGVLTVPPRQAELWRVANTSADTIMDLQVIYDGVAQSLYLAAIDGVPVNSQDGTGTGTLVEVRNFRLPPASRVEFAVVTPTAGVKSAQLVTANINTGSTGDCDPRRPLFQIATSAAAAAPAAHAARPLPEGAGQRFKRRAAAATPTPRTVYFAENADQTEFYMTVDGQPDKVFDPNQAPGIVTSQDAVELWTVQNRSLENHEFHIHQIHFLVESQDNFGQGHPPAPGIVGQYLDMIEVPAWDGVSAYPSVNLLMDFSGAVVGSFVFHCHILNHEDAGMMNIIQVLPPGGAPAKGASGPDTAPPAPHRH